MDQETRRPSGARPQGTRSPQGARRPQGSGRPAGSRPAPSGARRPANRATRSGGTGSEGGRRTPPSGRRPAPNGRSPYSGEKKKKSKVGKIVLFAVEILALAAMGIILWTVLKTEKVGKVDLDIDDIVINEEVKEKMAATSGDGESGPAMKGYRNIALFGVDSREGALTKNTRSDTIMIASINMDTGECRLVSVYRDTFLNLSNDSYNKCNSAYAKGGPKQAINMLNMNLDMNITDFVTIGFKGLEDTIDALGGVDINVREEEIVHLNNYQISMVGSSSDGEHFTANAGSDYIPVKSAGMQTLNGLQATAYCRIRYVGNDFERTQRQRDVLLACLEKAKKANPATLSKIATDVFEKTYTSLDLEEIIEVLSDINKYEVVGETGFPREDLLKVGTIGSKGSCVVPADLTENVSWLHEFLFEESGYDPSSSVKSYSQKITSETSSYLK